MAFNKYGIKLLVNWLHSNRSLVSHLAMWLCNGSNAYIHVYIPFTLVINDNSPKVNNFRSSKTQLCMDKIVHLKTSHYYLNLQCPSNGHVVHYIGYTVSFCCTLHSEHIQI